MPGSLRRGRRGTAERGEVVTLHADDLQHVHAGLVLFQQLIHVLDRLAQVREHVRRIAVGPLASLRHPGERGLHVLGGLDFELPGFRNGTGKGGLRLQDFARPPIEHRNRPADLETVKSVLRLVVIEGRADVRIPKAVGDLELDPGLGFGDGDPSGLEVGPLFERGGRESFEFGGRQR